jgi:hypothetical protein
MNSSIAGVCTLDLKTAAEKTLKSLTRRAKNCTKKTKTEDLYFFDHSGLESAHYVEFLEKGLTVGKCTLLLGTYDVTLNIDGKSIFGSVSSTDEANHAVSFFYQSLHSGACH